MPIMLTIEVSFIRAIISLPIEGIQFFMAWGATIFLRIVRRGRPRARPASVWPLSTERKPARIFSET